MVRSEKRGRDRTALYPSVSVQKNVGGGRWVLHHPVGCSTERDTTAQRSMKHHLTDGEGTTDDSRSSHGIHAMEPTCALQWLARPLLSIARVLKTSLPPQAREAGGSCMRRVRANASSVPCQLQRARRRGG